MNVDVNNTFGIINKGTGSSSEAGSAASGDEEDRRTEDSDSTGTERETKAAADTDEKTDFTPLDLEPRPFFSATTSNERDAQVHTDNNDANVEKHTGTSREELEAQATRRDADALLRRACTSVRNKTKEEQARTSLRNKFVHAGVVNVDVDVDGGGCSSSNSHHHEQHHYSNSRGASPLMSSDHESAISHARGTASPPPPPGLALPVATPTFPHERSPLHHVDPELAMRHHIHESALAATAAAGSGTTNPGAVGTGHTTSPDELRQLQGMNRAPSPLLFPNVDNNNNNNNHVSGMPPSLVNNHNHHSPGRMEAAHHDHAAVSGVAPPTLGTSPAPAVQMEFFIHPATNSAVIGSPPGVSHGPTSDSNYLEVSHPLHFF
jgi:hypothetical protein